MRRSAMIALLCLDKEELRSCRHANADTGHVLPPRVALSYREGLVLP